MDWFLYDNGLLHERVKIKNELAPPIMDSMFERRNEPYNRKKRTVHYGLKTLSYQSPQLWSLLPENIKEVESL